MTLTEAIKQNEEHAKHHRSDPYPDYFNALQLGIEALKRVELARHDFGYIDPSLLPGETEE